MVRISIKGSRSALNKWTKFTAHALQMKASENSIEMSGSYLYIPRNETVRPRYFCLPISTFMYL
jgi:hypothetical protein